MAVGDCLHIRDTFGGQIPGTSFAPHVYDSTILNENSTYTVGANDVEFTEAGDYFGFVSHRYRDTSNGRANYQGKIVVTAGSGELWVPWNTGYNRNSANQDGYVHTYFWYRAQVGDKLEFHTRRDTDAPTGGSVANECQLSMCRLWNPLAYGIYYDSTSTGRAQGTTPNDISFADILLQSDTSVIEKISSTVFRLKKQDTSYLVGYGVSGDQYTPSAFRTQRVSRINVNGTAYNCGDSYCFQRNSANEYAGLGALAVIRTGGTSSDIKIQAWQGDGTNPLSPGIPGAYGGCDIPAAWERVPNEGGLFIAEVPSWVHTFHTADDPIAGQNISGGDTDLHVVRNVNHMDPSWEKADTHLVRALVDMKAMLFANVRTARLNILDGTRGTHDCNVTKNGIVFSISRDGNYSRGYEPSAGSCFGGGFNPGGIFAGGAEISANDTLGVRTRIVGEAGNGGTISAGFCGLSITSFMGMPPGGGQAGGTRKLRVASGGLVRGRISTSGG